MKHSWLSKGLKKGRKGFRKVCNSPRMLHPLSEVLLVSKDLPQPFQEPFSTLTQTLTQPRVLHLLSALIINIYFLVYFFTIFFKFKESHNFPVFLSKKWWTHVWRSRVWLSRDWTPYIRMNRDLKSFTFLKLPYILCPFVQAPMMLKQNCKMRVLRYLCR